MSATASYGQFTEKEEKPIPSETLKDCDECADRELEYLETIKQQKVIIASQGVKLYSFEETLAMQSRVFHADKKTWAKAKRKAFWKGIKIGLGVGAGATAAIILFN